MGQAAFLMKNPASVERIFHDSVPVPAENILLNCSAPSGKQLALDGCSWASDVGSSYVPKHQAPTPIIR
ncbi:Potassium transporter 23 [Acorus calamus]|uniref:Potassium transporter 23 n=1 Tax=Acorus calamus TaxID=4465 RepID=A0AAV9D4M5_ACOCL|nr:Potassium transporter 23 [Acorus calamus]